MPALAAPSVRSRTSCSRTARPHSSRSAAGCPNIRGRSVLARTATGSVDSATPIKNPFAEKEVYHDNFLDKTFIWLYSRKMADQLGNVPVPDDPVYDDFVRISQEIMKGRSTLEQQNVVARVLSSLMPPGASEQFRKLFPPTQWSAEFNAFIAAKCFGWLVGPCELAKEDVIVAPGVVRQQNSVVNIKKCRYLEASGCVGMCFNMCKIPTQKYFTEEFGLPLTMNPNFEDLSCKMIFGQQPPSTQDDPAYAQPCFAVHCAVASARPSATPCPNVDTERAKRAKAA